MRRKKSIKRTVSLLLALTMTLSILLTSIGEVNGAQFFTIYFKPTSNWLEADARFAVYQFDSSGNNDWVDMTLCDENENVYSAEVNVSAYDNIIFCRMNPGSAENKWSNKWNQTADITEFASLYNEGYNYYILDNSGDGWNNLYGIWSVYIPTQPTKPTEPTVTTQPIETTPPTEPVTVAPTTFSYDNVLIGDIDMSGYINVSDVTYLQMYLACFTMLDEWNMLVADTNDDLKIDILDATMIQMYLAQFDIGDSKIGNYYNGGKHDGNLLRNGSFEHDKAGSAVPSWWGSDETYLATISVCDGGIDGSNCIKIDNTTYGWITNVSQTIKGLEPEQIYRVNAYVKTENIEGGPYDNGAHLRVEDSYSVEACGNWIKGTTGWQEVMLYFTANNKGEAKIMLRTDNRGILYFDDIRVTKVESYPDMYSSKVVLKGEYVDTYIKEKYVSGYTEEQLQTWIDYLDTAYIHYTELTGMEPFDGNKTVINCTEEPFCSQFVAYGKCNPIVFNDRFAEETLQRVAGQGILDFGLFHEMGHNFDTMYDWTFDDEITANYKMTYVLDNMGDKEVSIHGGIKASEFREYCKTMSDGSYKQIENRTEQYAGDGICYVMMRASDAVGWDTVKLAFRDYSDGMPDIRTAWGKFSYFMYLLQDNYNEINPDATGTEVIDSFPEGELSYLRGIFNSHYAPNGYIYAEDFFLEENWEYLKKYK